MKKFKFLIIDDSKTVQEEFSWLLQKAGHETHALSSCDKAMETILQLQPDCILCDLIMPGMDSLEFFKLVRSKTTIKQPIVVVISSKQYEYDRNRALDVGVDGYMTKPVNTETFADELVALIKGNMILTFWGCRGTFPIPGKKSIKYGGNTNCLSLQIGNHNFIFDAGTGIKELSNYIIENDKMPYRAKIFITHPHYDHINGIPFFTPLYISGNEFEFLGPDQADISLQKCLAMQMDSVFFPVKMEEFLSIVSFRSLTEESFTIDNIKIDTLLLNHPGRCLAYRIEYKGKKFCYLTDNELYLTTDTQRYVPDEVDRLIAFIHQVDVLIMDATYTDAEYVTKINWGHSPISRVIDVVHRAEVKLLCLHHHSPDQSDADIEAKLHEALELLKEKDSATRCMIAYEGQKMII